MTIFRIQVFVALVLCAGLAASPGQAETAAAKPNVTAHPTTATADDGWTGTGGIYRIIATSAGVLAGAGAMSLFIDGWVVELFQSTGNLTAREAVEIVQDIESQGGFEAAAVVLSGLAGGLIADNLYLKGAAVLPGAFDSVTARVQPTLDAASRAVTSATDWARNRFGDTTDWIQNRSREVWDRLQGWAERIPVPIGGQKGAPAQRPGP